MATEDAISNVERSMAKLTARIDDLEASNKSLFTGIQGRLDNHEAMHRTGALRLDDVYRSFTDRLSAKDATVQLIKDMSDSIQKQSDAIQRQLGLRFNFITGMTGFIALAFAASFSYNLFQVKEVNDAKSFLTDGTDVLTFDVVKYSEVLSGLAEGDAITTQGEREFLRNNFSDAATLANDAIKLLEPLLKETGIAEPGLLRNATFERSTCTNVMIASAMSPQPFTDGPHKSKEVEEKFSGLSPQTLRPALLEALFAAYDLHARGVFFGNAKYRDPIRHDGEVLLVINPTKWQGYHWVGLAAEDNAEFEQAKACFQNSVKNKPTVNKDHINLAELLFLDGRYEKATSEVLKYFPPDYRGFGSGTDVVAQFYLIASNYLSETPQPGILSPSNFMSNMAQLQNLRLEGSFLSTELDKALDETKPSGQNFAKKDRLKKAVVLKMAVCLKTRKCES